MYSYIDIAVYKYTCWQLYVLSTNVKKWQSAQAQYLTMKCLYDADDNNENDGADTDYDGLHNDYCNNEDDNNNDDDFD